MQYNTKLLDQLMLKLKNEPDKKLYISQIAYFESNITFFIGYLTYFSAYQTGIIWSQLSKLKLRSNSQIKCLLKALKKFWNDCTSVTKIWYFFPKNCISSIGNFYSMLCFFKCYLHLNHKRYNYRFLSITIESL